MDDDRNLGAIGRLARELCRLPGIGPKSAERLTFFLLAGDRRVARELSDALRGVVEAVKPCRECFDLTEAQPCSVCADARRDSGQLCVVESSRDLAVFERIGSYRGRYHVLGGRLAPLDNMGPERLTVVALLRRVRRGGVTEIILATSPTLEGDGTALYISQLVADFPVEVTRLARGITVGSVLEFANKEILADALAGRQKF